MKKFSSLLIYLKNYKLLFCILVFVFLIMPFLFISKENISIKENRGLNKFPSFFSENGKINEKFGIEFNDWFSDRFGGREVLINSRFNILYFLNNRKENEKAFMGDGNWIFSTNGITKNIPMSEQKKIIIKIADNIKKIDNYFAGKDVQIYLILEPSRSTLYKQYWTNYYSYIPHFEYYKQLKEELNGRSNIHFVELESIFEENKNRIQLYEKNDSHMTLRGVNIMIEQIISAIDQNMPNSDFANHYNNSIKYKDKDCRLFPFSNSLDKELNIKSELKPETCKRIRVKNKHAKLIHKELGLNETINSEPYIDKDLYILFPCYEEFTFPVLREFFAHTISVNYNAQKIPDENALKQKCISKLKSVNPEATVLIFIAYPTEDIASITMDYLEAF